MITSEEFKDSMEEIRKSKLVGDRHYEADGLMRKILKEHGYEDGVNIFKNMGKWYE